MFIKKKIRQLIYTIESWEAIKNFVEWLTFIIHCQKEESKSQINDSN